MTAGIQLSKKHGLNPTIMKCFWCGNDIGVALLGKLKDDMPAPKEAILNYEPCDECKAKFEAGIFIFEATKEPQSEHQMAINSDQDEPPAYPTGRFVVLPPESMKDGQAGMLFAMEPSEFEELIEDIRKEHGEEAFRYHEYHEGSKQTAPGRNKNLN